MKFVDMDGKEYEFATPGEAVRWAMRELKSINKKIEDLYKQIKELSEYKDRVCKEFGLKKYTRRKGTALEKQEQPQKEPQENVVQSETMGVKEVQQEGQ